MNMKYFHGFAIILLLFASVNVHAQTFKSEGDFKKYFTEHADSLDPVEGLWTVNTTQEFYNYDTLYDSKSFSQTVAVIKRDSVFFSYDMKGGAYNVYFNKTKVNKVYLFKIFLKEINQYTKADAVISADRTMEYNYEFPKQYLQLVFKDSFESGEHVENKVTWNKIFPK